jgi:hypothetical protein
MSENSNPSKKLILQRVRNRIIEYFELASDFGAQEQFGANYIINDWESWQDSALDTVYPDPIFTIAERNAMAAFDLTWHLAVSVTNADMPSVSELRTKLYWQELTASAASAFSVFMQRDKLPEDHEVTT